MDHAYPSPRSFGLDTHNLPSSPQASQAAEKRAAYIARVVAEAPPLTAAQIDRLAGIFSPVVERTNATPAISVGTYQTWEMKRYEDAGQHGYYTADGEAA